MPTPSYSVGHAVFIRSDRPDYPEERVSFQNLEELIQLCSRTRPGCSLEQVVFQAREGETPIAVTLNFLAVSRGRSSPKPPSTSG